MKITISWGKNDTFDSRNKFHEGDFSGGVNEYIFGYWVGSPHLQGFHECLGGQWRINLGDNPAGI